MSARVIPLEDAAAVKGALTELMSGLEAGRLRGVALIAVDASGGFEPFWGASRTLGPHAGSILRGAVAWLGARMDVSALAAESSG